MIYRFGNTVLDTSRRQLLVDGASRPVEPQVFDLLAHLVENNERVVGREEMLRAIGAGQFVTDSVLSTRLSAARRAIGDDGREQQLIRTFRRRGLRFVAAVTKIAAMDHATNAPGGESDLAIPTPAEQPRARWQVLAAIGAIFLSDATGIEQVSQEISSGIILGLSALI